MCAFLSFREYSMRPLQGKDSASLTYALTDYSPVPDMNAVCVMTFKESEVEKSWHNRG